MTTFKKTATGISITGNNGQTAELGLQDAYNLLAWLYNQRDQLFAKLHDLPSAPVRVYSVRADTLSQDAIRLLNETPLEWKFTDVLVPVAEEEDK